MNDAAARLRVQKVYSTDPEYLERMAQHEEARNVRTCGNELKGKRTSETTDNCKS